MQMPMAGTHFTKFNDLTLLKDMRPLFLIETLQILWKQSIMEKIQQGWAESRDAEQGTTPLSSGMGTSTATILHIDSDRAAVELCQELHRSSLDKSWVFDLVRKNLMQIAWYRRGD